MRPAEAGHRVGRMSWFVMIYWLHIAAGALAFAVVSIPLLARKGGRAHVRFGRVYVYAMAALAVTGVPLAARGLAHEDPVRRANALFLFFIALLAADSAWMGVGVLRAAKGSPAARGGPARIGPPAVLLLAALGLLVLGILGRSVLHVSFALLGVTLATGRLAFWRRFTRTRADAIVMHIGAMGVSCITTLTAFVITNARHFFHARPFTLALWIAPTVLGTAAIGLSQRAWRARLTRGEP